VSHLPEHTTYPKTESFVLLPGMNGFENKMLNQKIKQAD
jgi:hypothetical protein